MRLRLHRLEDEGSLLSSTRHTAGDVILPKKSRKSAQDKRTFSCTFCKYKSDGNCRLDDHILVHHTKEKCEVCQLCSSRFILKCQLVVHMQKVHGPFEVHQCLHCDKSFSSAKKLKTHLPNHAPTRPYKCDRCAYSAFQKILKIHVEKAHLGITFSCSQCKATYNSRGSLAKHFKWIHGNPGISYCSMCDFKTVVDGSLKKHIC